MVFKISLKKKNSNLGLTKKLTEKKKKIKFGFDKEINYAAFSKEKIINFLKK